MMEAFYLKLKVRLNNGENPGIVNKLDFKSYSEILKKEVRKFLDQKN